MLVITERGDKADIRQIVGRDGVSGRISAMLPVAPVGPREPPALMSKGLQGF
jgi:hypothetical protein